MDRRPGDTAGSSACQQKFLSLRRPHAFGPHSLGFPSRLLSVLPVARSRVLPVRLTQAGAIENRMDGAPGGNPDVAGEPAHQELPDLACAPMRLVAFEPIRQ